MNTIRFEGREWAPSKIVCVGQNYAEHVKELGGPMPEELTLFMKPNAAIASALRSRHEGETLHYECEICFLAIGGRFAAVGLGLDLTKRETQGRLRRQGLPWERCKSFAGSAVFGEFIRFEGDVGSLELEMKRNGAIVQHGGVADMIYKPDFVLSEIQRNFGLEDGDIVMTGTPSGVGPIAKGDVFEWTLRGERALLESGLWSAID